MKLREKEAVNSLIVEAICESDREVAKVIMSWTPESGQDRSCQGG